MIDQIKKYLLLVKEYWEYSIIILPIIIIIILPIILMYFLKVEPSQTPFLLHYFFFALSLIVISFVICLLITNIKYKNETTKQLFYRYYKVGLIIPVFFLISAPIFSVLFVLLHQGNGITDINPDNIFWFLVSIFFMGIVTVFLCISIGYITRFILTVGSSSTFYTMTLRVITVLLISVLVIFIFWKVKGGSDDFIASKNADSISEISFSPDGKKIIFNREKGGLPKMISVYDLETGDMIAYQPPKGEYWSQARYSPDSSKIVFVTIPRGNKYFEHDKAQLAVMDTDGKNIRKITNTNGYKAYPSFSHSGDRVIFRAADDIYEVEINNFFKENRLTWFKFSVMSAPYYFPDDETIIFSAYGTPGMFPGIAETDHEAIRRKQLDLDARSQQVFRRLGDNIYIVKKGQKELPEPLIRSKDGLREPRITTDGTIFFQTQAYKPDGKGDGMQWFQYSADGNHRRITHQHIFIKDLSVSPSGEQMVIIYEATKYINKILIYQVKDGASREIILPDHPSRIINSN